MSQPMGVVAPWAELIRHAGHRIEIHGWRGKEEGGGIDDGGVDDLAPIVVIECVDPGCDETRLVQVVELNREARLRVLKEMQGEDSEAEKTNRQAEQDWRDQYTTNGRNM